PHFSFRGSGPEGGSDHRLTYRLIAKYSSSAHERVLRFRVGGTGGPTDGSVSPVVEGSDPVDDGVRRGRPVQTEGPDERPPIEGELQTPFRGVQMRPTTRSRSVGVGLHGPSRVTATGDDSHQSGLVRTLPTTDARANHRPQV